MTHVLAQATVDLIRAGLPSLVRGQYRVTVTGRTTLGRPLPCRIYDVEALDMDTAAEGCIKLYVAEFDPPRPLGTMLH